MPTHDLVIRGGTVVDGSGSPPREADVAIDGGIVTAVESHAGQGRREINTRNLLVTPGFVDIHTHYDAQAIWDPWLMPSSLHGVTTVVMGNCGVGFAPVRPGGQSDLIDLMEAVEDIPGAAMHEGIRWEWEHFPEFMDALERRAHAVDYGVQVPHCAVRTYVMGERGVANEAATPADIAAMRAIVRDGLKAGALGFSTSRTELHRTLLGEAVPGTFADRDEVFGIGEELRAHGSGVFQVSVTHRDVPKEFVWMKELARRTGRTVTFNLQQVDEAPDLYKQGLRLLDEARAEGIANVRGQFSGRPVGVLMGWRTTAHPFVLHPEFRRLSHLGPAEMLAELRRPEVRAAILTGDPIPDPPPTDTVVPIFFLQFLLSSFSKMFPLVGDADYEPTADRSLGAQSSATGRPALELAYDAMMADDGRGLLYFPLFGYSGCSFEAIRETMLHPQTGLSLADGGAHCGVICDAGIPTFMLSYWARDRRRGERLPLEFVVRRQTWDTAAQYGLRDRGLLAPGYKADVNVIDYERLRLTRPEVRYDLPAGGRRLFQGAEGYRATVVTGEVTFENGEPSGAIPGSLLRGVRGPAPGAAAPPLPA